MGGRDLDGSGPKVRVDRLVGNDRNEGQALSAFSERVNLERKRRHHNFQDFLLGPENRYLNNF